MLRKEDFKKLYGIEIKEEKIEISTDTREEIKGKIFLPLSGENFDGHDFINKSFENGCKFSFCEREKINKVTEENKKRIILIENALEEYQKIANYYRKKINPRIIAITGSSGKTTTKELFSSIFSSKYKTQKTEKNYNNEIGVPKTILNLKEDTEILILELAMRGKGEIRTLSKIAEPDIGIITNIGVAHIGRLGSRQNILEAKAEIVEYMRENGLLIIHEEEDLIKHIKSRWKGRIKTFKKEDAKEVFFENGKTNFTYEKEKYFINALGEVHILNAISGIITGKELGMTKKEIQKGLEGFTIPQGRGNIIKITEKLFVIDESYNANPETVEKAVTNLKDCFDNSFKKIVVLGEIAELGSHEEKLINDLGKWLESKKLNKIITIGDKLKEIKEAENTKDINSCLEKLDEIIKEAEKLIILVKGSHIAGLEQLIKKIVEKEKIKV